MHKKYISSGAFRNLVRPIMASGIEPIRGESIRITVN